jgi:hypothetical protein
MINEAFRASVRESLARALREREERDVCPREMGGCGRAGSLCTVNHRSFRLFTFCPFCGWDPVKKGEALAKKNAAKSAAKAKLAATKKKAKRAP